MPPRDTASPTGMAQDLGEVTKSPNDKRAYRSIRLQSNGLRVLLVSDAETDMSAAAMDVGVGSYGDHEHCDGLAHFCEHMLFLGTDKYPDENDYASFLADHGGYSNAYTDQTHTNYFFGVNPDFLEGALDRFAQFFIAPQFTESATEREMTAVNSEHSKNTQSDFWRAFQLIKLHAQESHPFRKFSTGSLKTLRDGPRDHGVDIRQALLDFHAEHYSANTMRLVVLGRESLDELQQLAVDMFSPIENKDARPVVPSVRPFANLPRFIQQVPVADQRSLIIGWPVPPVWLEHRVKPLSYLAHLVGHEGTGSLLSYLKKEGLANALGAYPFLDYTDFAFFVCNVTLTPDGVERYREVADAVFAYTAMLRKEGPQEWVHEEVKLLRQISFNFLEKSDPMDYVSGLSVSMQRYPSDKTISGDKLIGAYEAAELSRYADLLTVDNALLLLSARSLEAEGMAEDPNYTTRYRSAPLDESDARRWRGLQPSDFPALRLPDKNPFIADDFSLVGAQPLPPVAKVFERSAVPHLLRRDGCSMLWYKADSRFLVPTATTVALLRVPNMSANVRLEIGMLMWKNVVIEALNELAYHAECADLTYHIATCSVGVEVKISGPAQKLPELLTACLEYLVKDSVFDDAPTFERVREHVAQKYGNVDFQRSYRHALNLRNLCLKNPSWTSRMKKAAAETMTVAEVRAARNTLLEGLAVEMLVHGNIAAADAVRMYDGAVATLSAAAAGDAQQTPVVMERARAVALSQGAVYRARMRHPNADDENSAVEILVKCGEDTDAVGAKAALFANLVNEPAFDALRTKEQLGYIVFTQKIDVLSRDAFVTFIVQSATYPPEFLESRVRVFLRGFRKFLVAMEQDRFVESRTALVQDITRKTVSLTEEGNNIARALDVDHHFERRFARGRIIESLAKQDMLDFFDAFFDEGAPTRTWFITHCAAGHLKLPGEDGFDGQLEQWAKKGLREPPAEDAGAEEPAAEDAGPETPSEAELAKYTGSADGAIEITDPFVFKSRMPLHPCAAVSEVEHEVVEMSA